MFIFFRKSPFLVLLFLCTILNGCSSGGSSNHSSEESPSTEVSGIVAKGPATGANVKFYSIDSFGEETFLTATVTEKGGFYSAMIPVTSRLIRVEADLEGADIEDEITGRTYKGRRGEVLTSVMKISEGSDSYLMNVTPFSTMAEEMARILGDGICTESTVSVANGKIKSWAGVDFLQGSPTGDLKASLTAVAQMVNESGSITITMHNLLGAIRQNIYGVYIDGQYSLMLADACRRSGSDDCDTGTNFADFYGAQTPVSINTVDGSDSEIGSTESELELGSEVEQVKAPWTLMLPSNGNYYNNYYPIYVPNNVPHLITSDGTYDGTVEWELGAYSSWINIFTSSDKSEAVFQQGNALYSIQDTLTEPKLIADDVVSNSPIRIGELFIASNNNSYYGDPSNVLRAFITDGTLSKTNVIDEVDISTDYYSIVDHENMTIWNTKNTIPYGTELFITKVTEDAVSTALVKDIGPGAMTGFSTRNWNKAFLNNGKIVFATSYGTWVSDGTADGTFNLGDVAAGNNYASFRNQVAFRAYSNSNQFGTELYFTDGTQDGTYGLDINPGSSSSYPTILCQFGEKLYFRAQVNSETSINDYIFSSDGQTFTPLVQINSRTNLLGYTEKIIFFKQRDDEYGDELWGADLSSGEYKLVKDILPGTGAALAQTSATILGDYLLFSAYTSAYDSGWFVSDGSTDGTIEIANFSAFIYEQVGDTLIFADNLGCYKLSLTGPVSAPTKLLTTENAGSYIIKSDADQAYISNQSGTLYTVSETGNEAILLLENVSQFKVVAENALYIIQEIEEQATLWYSDGTPEGTRYVAKLEGSANNYNMNSAEVIKTK